MTDGLQIGMTIRLPARLHQPADGTIVATTYSVLPVVRITESQMKVT